MTSRQPPASALENACRLLFLSFCLLTTMSKKVSTFSGDDVRMMGRFFYDESGEAWDFDFPGSEIAFTTTAGCSSASIELSQMIDDKYGQPQYFEVFVDGLRVLLNESALHSFSTENWISSDINSVKLADLDARRSHIIQVFKATEPQWNSITVVPNYMSFHGLELEGNTTCSIGLKPTVPSRRLEFIGDSITCGFCNLCEAQVRTAEFGTALDMNMPRQTAAAATGDVFLPTWLQSLKEVAHDSDTSAVEESHWDAWPARISRALNAEFHTAAWSGYGLVQNCCGGNTTMPMIFGRTLASDGDPKKAWDMSTWTPDAVVVNLGTNDGAVATTSEFIEEYIALATNITSAYGSSTHLFLACGPMSNLYCDAVLETIDILSSQGLNAHFLDQRNSAMNACCGHPDVTDDIYMAESGANFIAGLMGW